MRIPSGVPGFDDIVQGGLPFGTSVGLLGPSGTENLSFAIAFLAEGLREGASGLLLVSSVSVDDVLAELRSLGVDVDKAGASNRFRIVDWSSWRTQPVKEVEEAGPVLRASGNLTNVRVALGRAIAALVGDKPKRAVAEILSPATIEYPVGEVYAFAQSLKGKFERAGFTALITIEKDRHTPSELSTLQQPFDGLIEIERARVGEQVLAKIGVIHMKDTISATAFRILQSGEDGLRVVLENQEAATVRFQENPASTTGSLERLCPLCETPIAHDVPTCPACGARLLPYSPTGGEGGPTSAVGIHAPGEVPTVDPRTDIPEGSGSPPDAPPDATPRPQPRRAPKSVVTRGRGLTNGSVRESATRKSVGMTNGIRGRTNGLTNGLRGRTNGLTNGLGRTNGLGEERGQTNGLTNGIASLRRGITNGLTNGNGFTNGLGSPRFRREAYLSRWRLWLIPLVAVGLLLVPLFVPPDLGPPGLIQIDGQFSDWAPLGLVVQASRPGLGPNVDLRRLGLVDSGPGLAVYAEVAGEAFSGGGTPVRYDTLRLFLDIDRNVSTGYRGSGIGADRLVEVLGHSRGISATRLLEWDGNREPSDWSGWIKGATIRAASLGPRVELEIDWDLLSSEPSPLRMYAHFQAYDGTSDESDAVLALGGSSLLVDLEPTASEILSGTDRELLRLHLRCLVGVCSYDSVTGTLTGTVNPVAVSALRLRDPGGAVLQQWTPGGARVTFAFGSRTLDTGASETLSIHADVAGGAGATLGATVTGPGDVSLASGVVTLHTLPSPRSVGYLGFVPAGIAVDGGFSDWTNVSTDPSELGRRPDVDLTTYAIDVSGSVGALHLAVSGRAFNGTLVPEENVPVPSIVPGPADSDRDTVPDSQDPSPFDFDNDGVDDVNAGGDLDGDSSTDYPAGPDVYLNTSIPSTFPPPYANKAVSVYIGPSLRPLVYGEDVWRVFLDADNRSATGFRVKSLGADYLVEIRGKYGEVTYRGASVFAGSSPLEWSWSPVAGILVASDYARIEAGFDASALGLSNATAAYFEVMDWTKIPDGPVDAVFRIGGAMSSSAVDRSPSPGSVSTFDLSGNERWFFTNTDGNEVVCDVNKDASLAQGASAASVTLSTQGGTACWFSPDGLPDTIAGIWEVILDIETVTSGTQVFSPSALGDVNAWTTSGTSGCNSEGNEEKCVDETTSDNDATYVTSTSNSQTDSLYNLPDWAAPSPLSVSSFVVEASCRKMTGATVSVAIILKSGGTVFTGASGGQDCANSGTYSVWTDSWANDPSDGSPWTSLDLDALQVGFRDGDAAADEVRASHIKVTVTYVPVYSVEINECTNSGCSGTAVIYAATNFITYGPDVTIQTGTIGARSMTGQQHVQWKITLVSGGSVRIRMNGPYPGTDDSRATVPVPEVEALAIPIGGAILVVIASRRWRLRRTDEPE
ncbi:MAG TPA: ATPase domain-containing protein [Thermoplasmata archaeon]|nr:ATPase domain-containing protein [Thermoplasmata archaeon]